MQKYILILILVTNIKCMKLTNKKTMLNEFEQLSTQIRNFIPGMTYLNNLDIKNSKNEYDINKLNYYLLNSCENIRFKTKILETIFIDINLGISTKYEFSSKEYLKLVSFLKENNVNLNLIHDGFIVIKNSAYYANPNLLKYYLDNGLNILSKDIYYESILEIFIKSKNIKALELSLKRSVDNTKTRVVNRLNDILNYKPRIDQDIISFIIKNSDIATFKVFIKYFKSLFIDDIQKENILFLSLNASVKYQNHEICKYILNSYDRYLRKYPNSLNFEKFSKYFVIFQALLKNGNLHILKLFHQNKFCHFDQYTDKYLPNYNYTYTYYPFSLGYDKMIKYLVYRTNMPIYIYDDKEELYSSLKIKLLPIEDLPLEKGLESLFNSSFQSILYHKFNNKRLSKIDKNKNKIIKLLANYFINCKPGVINDIIVKNYIKKNSIIYINNDVIKTITDFCIGRQDKSSTDCSNKPVPQLFLEKMIKHLLNEPIKNENLLIQLYEYKFMIKNSKKYFNFLFRFN